MEFSHDALEVEITLRVPSAAAARELVERAGFREEHPRALEHNVVFDTPDLSYKRQGMLVRLRRYGGQVRLTFKGPKDAGSKHKSREEREVEVSDFDGCRYILAGLGLEPKFRYEKYRAEYRRLGERGAVLIDETPIGDFIELEGPPEWIDSAARELGFSEREYIVPSYAALYAEYRRAHPEAPADMVFAGNAPGDTS